jgi:tetratricopeptide (TPR) repeat protein
MPNKTLYVKEADLRLFEQAQEQLGDSVSSVFAEFLRERMAKLTPEENRIIELINEIARKRDSLQKERGLPQFIDGEYAEAVAYAEKALQSLRKGAVRNAKALYYAANIYRERAEQDVKETRDLGRKIAGMLDRGNRH